jgi:hypothetical protein
MKPAKAHMVCSGWIADIRGPLTYFFAGTGTAHRTIAVNFYLLQKYAGVAPVTVCGVVWAEVAIQK